MSEKPMSQEDYGMEDLGTMIKLGEDERVIDLIIKHPELKEYRSNNGSCAFRVAIQSERETVWKFLVSIGAPLDLDGLDGGTTMLQMAIDRGNLDLVRTLLELGANPNVGRTIFVAKNCRHEKGLDALKLLLEYGVDVNQLFAMFGKKKNVRSALDFCEGRPDFVEVLRTAGAKTSAEILSDNPKANIRIDD